MPVAESVANVFFLGKTNLSGKIVMFRLRYWINLNLPTKFYMFYIDKNYYLLNIKSINLNNEILQYNQSI